MIFLHLFKYLLISLIPLHFLILLGKLLLPLLVPRYLPLEFKSEVLTLVPPLSVSDDLLLKVVNPIVINSAELLDAVKILHQPLKLFVCEINSGQPSFINHFNLVDKLVLDYPGLILERLEKLRQALELHIFNPSFHNDLKDHIFEYVLPNSSHLEFPLISRPPFLNINRKLFITLNQFKLLAIICSLKIVIYVPHLFNDPVVDEQ